MKSALNGFVYQHKWSNVLHVHTYHAAYCIFLAHIVLGSAYTIRFAVEIGILVFFHTLKAPYSLSIHVITHTLS